MKKLIQTGYEDGPEEPNGPRAEGIGWHFHIVRVRDCGPHFGVRRLVFPFCWTRPDECMMRSATLHYSLGHDTHLPLSPNWSRGWGRRRCHFCRCRPEIGRRRYHRLKELTWAAHGLESSTLDEPVRQRVSMQITRKRTVVPVLSDHPFLFKHNHASGTF